MRPELTAATTQKSWDCLDRAMAKSMTPTQSHMGIFVTNMERMVRFYGEVLGLTVTGVSYAEVAPRGARSSRASGCAGCQPAR